MLIDFATSLRLILSAVVSTFVLLTLFLFSLRPKKSAAEQSPWASVLALLVIASLAILVFGVFSAIWSF